MPIEVGTIYQISQGIKGFYNSANTLTIIRKNDRTAQFTLGDGKGYGSMPIKHLLYLIKRDDLTVIDDMLSNTSEEHIS